MKKTVVRVIAAPLAVVLLFALGFFLLPLTETVRRIPVKGSADWMKMNLGRGTSPSPTVYAGICVLCRSPFAGSVYATFANSTSPFWRNMSVRVAPSASLSLRVLSSLSGGV